MNNLFEIGFVKNTHGLKGMVEIKHNVKIDLNNLINKKLFLFINGIYDPFIIKSVLLKKNNFAILLSEITNINQAYKYLNASVFISEKDIDNINNLLNCNIIGFKAIDNLTKDSIGVISDINNLTKNKFLIIFNKENNKEVLIPYVKNFVEKIDYKLRIIYLNLIKGL